ncbi:MAG: dethiobiotin synthase [Blastocatellia bacterium]|nr:dethiobiotin synthase [Blastocatellia bacterium]
MRGLFITGTDTNVGKTVVSAALMHYLRKWGNGCYWKPVQTGIEVDNDTESVKTLGNCSETEIHDFGYRLRCPVSPHLAAELSGVHLSIDEILQKYLPKKNATYIVEGAGGLLVPLNEKELVADLIRAVALPALIVSRSTLGTINHTVLTIEALRSRSIDIAGIIMVGEKNQQNRRAIEFYGGVCVVGEMPHFESLSSERLSDWALQDMDKEEFLKKFL